MNTRLTLIVLSVLLLTACNSSSQAENAGRAMAETACLILDENSGNTEDLAAAGEEIMKKYGFESGSAVDEYLISIEGTEEINTVNTTARDSLEATCGSALEAKGVSAADLANAMVGL